MAKRASSLRRSLRRSVAAADPGRFAGGSAVIEPLGLLAVERERLAAQQRSASHDEMEAGSGSRVVVKSDPGA